MDIIEVSLEDRFYCMVKPLMSSYITGVLIRESLEEQWCSL